jgi:hypothetical protein
MASAIWHGTPNRRPPTRRDKRERPTPCAPAGGTEWAYLSSTDLAHAGQFLVARDLLDFRTLAVSVPTDLRRVQSQSAAASPDRPTNAGSHTTAMGASARRMP